MSQVKLETSRKYRRVQYKDSAPSMTKQSHKAECDVNNILERYRKTGIITHVKQGGMHGDFSNITSYQDAVEAVKLASQSFMSLPASLRARFQNDPGLFLDFTADPKNLDEMKQLGLLKEQAPVDDKAMAPAATDGSGSPSSKPS